MLPAVLTQYFIAFTTYGMAQIVDSTPSYRSGYYREVFDKLILMMNSTAMEEFEWIDQGYSEDFYTDFNGGGDGFRGTANIMWTGHYALMELLYYNVFRDDKFNSEIEYYMDDWNNTLTANETWDGRPANGLGKYGCGLIPCEPYIVFVQCNSIPFYTMRMYDKFYGTDYSQSTEPGIDWWLDNMTDDRGVQVDGYFVMEPDVPEKGRSDLPVSYPSAALTAGTSYPKVAVYGSSWASMFYHAFGRTDISTQYYANIKKNFIHYSTGNTAYAVDNYHNPSNFGMMDLLGTFFTYFCAREMQDWDLFRKIENWFYGPYPGFWDGDIYRFDASALGDDGPFFEPILNFVYAWGHAASNLTDLMSPRDDTFFSTPYISDESTKNGLFIYQAYYDETENAFILTVEAGEETVLTFDNFPGVTGVYQKSGEYTNWSQSGAQLLLTLSPGTHSFIII